MSKKQPSFPYLFNPDEKGCQIPRAIIINVIRKMQIGSFVNLFRSCKLTKDFIEDNKKYIKLSSGNLKVTTTAQESITSFYIPESNDVKCVLIQFDNEKGKSSTFWNETFKNHGFVYFNFKTLNLGITEKSKCYSSLINAYEECNIRCDELKVYSNGNLSSKIIDVLKPRKMYINGKIPDNIIFVPHFQYIFRRGDYDKEIEYVLTELPYFYKGKLQLTSKCHLPRWLPDLLSKCLKDMINGRVVLRELQFDAFHRNDEMDLFEELAQQSIEPAVLENISDISLSIAAYPAKNERFLFVFRAKLTHRVKVTSSWGEIESLIDEFLEDIEDGECCRMRKSTIKSEIQDKIRQLFE